MGFGESCWNLKMKSEASIYLTKHLCPPQHELDFQVISPAYQKILRSNVSQPSSIKRYRILIFHFSRAEKQHFSFYHSLSFFFFLSFSFFCLSPWSVWKLFLCSMAVRLIFPLSFYLFLLLLLVEVTLGTLSNEKCDTCLPAMSFKIVADETDLFKWGLKKQKLFTQRWWRISDNHVGRCRLHSKQDENKLDFSFFHFCKGGAVKEKCLMFDAQCRQLNPPCTPGKQRTGGLIPLSFPFGWR